MRIPDPELKKLLSSSGMIKPEELEDAMPKEEGDDSLQTTVLKRKLISDKDLTKLYATSIDVPYMELADIKIPRELLLKIPERIARKYLVVLFGIEEDQLQLAMAEPSPPRRSRAPKCPAIPKPRLIAPIDLCPFPPYWRPQQRPLRRPFLH